MAFFEKLNQVAKNLGDKTTDAIEITKLTTKIASENMACAEQLKKIGEFYYKQYVSGKEVEAEVVEFCTAAKVHYDAIDAAQAEIERIKAENEAGRPDVTNEKVENRCPSCSEINAPNMKFCQNCGMKLESEEVKPQNLICPSCAKQVMANTRFCPECGMKMEG